MVYLKLIRVKHYIKNLLVFAPLIFAGRLFEWSLTTKALAGFFAFSFVASIVYIINDINDLEDDKRHPIKKNRPLASGLISITNAKGLVILLGFLSIGLNILFNNTLYSWSILFLYLIINILYSYGLKSIPLVDISIIVLGFILRLVFGGIVTGIEISHWMILTVISLSFYLALGKRRNELKKNNDGARSVLKYYTENFLDKNMYMCLGLTNVFYALWSVSPSDILDNSNLVWTAPVVLLICMKYSMNIERDSHGDPADVIFEDKMLLTLILMYGISLVTLIYI